MSATSDRVARQLAELEAAPDRARLVHEAAAGRGTGSSVPEAARAAEWEQVSRRIGPIQPETFLAAAEAYADGGPAPLASAVIAAIQQFAPTIVAAAVAEERAAVGALLLNLADEIETLGTDNGKDYAHPYARDGYQAAADYVRSRRIDRENAN